VIFLWGKLIPMDPTIAWSPAPRVLTLAPTSLHVWRASLDVPPESLPRFSAILSEKELARAKRFVFDRDRYPYIVAQATLRLLLGTYLQSPPGSVRTENGPQGKPFLAKQSHASGLQFNLSHSHGMALFAFALQRELGIDIEKIRPNFASRDIAQRYFSRQEIAELDALPPASYTEAFFLCWTRKEAYIKARGQGLHIPLDSFSVTLTPDRPAGLTSSDSECWSVYSFRPSAEFVGAVVAERCEWELSFYDASDLL
jgi:4'-phosphopantetheinyl transferase